MATFSQPLEDPWGLKLGAIALCAVPVATGELDPFDGPCQQSRNATPSSWALWYNGTDDDPHQSSRLCRARGPLPSRLIRFFHEARANDRYWQILLQKLAGGVLGATIESQRTNS